MRFQGRISEWRDDRGFGFITPNGGGEPVFVHVKAFDPPARRPVGGELVNYHVARDAKGRVRAERVAYVSLRRGARAPGAHRKGARATLVAVATVFLGAVAALAAAGRVPWVIAGVYAVMSLVAYVAYAVDKSAARSGGRRTPENTLQMLALLGGWPGALLAQQRLRHKSSKAAFLAVFWCAVALNVGALLWVLGSDAGARLLGSLLR